MHRINLSDKTKYALIITFLALLLSLFFITRIAAARENMRSGDNIILQKDEVINKDYFAGGETVTIAGTINGDAYIGGGKIIVDGTINGDLITGGGEIIVNGTVTQNLRAAGGNITVTGTVGRNATILGGNINLTKSAEVTGSLTSAGGNLSLYSPIGTDLYLGAGDVTIGNSVGGDITAGVGNLTLLPEASIGGNINYFSEKTAQILPGASVSGQLKHTIPPQDEKQKAEKAAEYAADGFSVFYKSITFISLLILGLLFIKLVPKFSLQTAQTFSSGFWTNLVVGILTMVIVPAAFILILITVVGIPLALLLLFAFFLSIYVSKIFVSIWVGNFLAGKLNQKWNLYISFITGLIILTLLSLIPILGMIIGIIVNIAGLGALLITKKNYYLKLRKEL